MLPRSQPKALSRCLVKLVGQHDTAVGDGDASGGDASGGDASGGDASGVERRF